MSGSIDHRELRNAFARFATGVAVVTACAPDGRRAGVTVNSLTSVSLDPPLLLWGLKRSASSLQTFLAASHFAVHVLGEAQQSLSERFAAPAEDRFAGLDCTVGEGGAPLLEGCLASFECANSHRMDGGDHVLFVGEVERFRYRAGAPLLFFASRYDAARLRTDPAQTVN